MKTSTKTDLVNVHPLVLLSVVDHYSRVIGTQQEPQLLNRQNQDGDCIMKEASADQRVAGILLGHRLRSGVVTVTNSYAVPFEEDPNDPNVWFFDHNYHLSMYGLFRKVNSKEEPVGWYHTGPKLCNSDIHIHEFITKHIKTTNPIILVINAQTIAESVPMEAYEAVENPREMNKWIFEHIYSQIEAEEAEEVSVEHLLRDIKNHRLNYLSHKTDTVGDWEVKIPESLCDAMENRIKSLKTLRSQINNVVHYLDQVIQGELPKNDALLELIQNTLNYLPNIEGNLDWNNATVKQSNNELVCIYLALLVKSITTIHSLIDNKIQLSKDVSEKTT